MKFTMGYKGDKICKLVICSKAIKKHRDYGQCQKGVRSLTLLLNSKAASRYLTVLQSQFYCHSSKLRRKKALVLFFSH